LNFSETNESSVRLIRRSSSVTFLVWSLLLRSSSILDNFSLSFRTNHNAMAWWVVTIWRGSGWHAIGIRHRRGILCQLFLQFLYLLSQCSAGLRGRVHPQWQSTPSKQWNGMHKNRMRCNGMEWNEGALQCAVECCYCTEGGGRRCRGEREIME